MKLRALWIWPLSALACASAVNASGGVQPRLHAGIVLVPQFRFDAGAPLLAPAGVAADGTLCVGTVDGYVHSLNPDGSFRWSHTVRGAVDRRPLHAGQLWYLATNTDRVYALRGDGSLAWIFKPPSPIDSELSADDTGVAYYFGKDGFLYGLSGRGGVSLRVNLGALQAGPSLGPDGAVWARTRLGAVLQLRSAVVRRVAEERATEVSFTDPGWLLDPQRHEWHGRSDGMLEFSWEHGANPITLPLGSSPLLTPAWSSFSGYALVSARSGLVFGIDASGRPRSP